jgi:hypothetical protein
MRQQAAICSCVCWRRTEDEVEGEECGQVENDAIYSGLVTRTVGMIVSLKASV